ncbi:MAG: rRNA maturation RNase YbeY [Candidatus Borkfalkiaceae bacterium]|nr:rRNA maturation RNase YbeY [Christensenellaceae bacterium]
MGKLKIECLQRKVKLKNLAKAVYTVLGQKENLKAELVFETGADMTDLNRTARGVNSVTDVLSFPSLDGIKGEILRREKCNTELDGRYIFIGSIVLCDDKIRAQAEELGHSEEEERDYLVIHGLMHLMGYDHMTEEDKREMREKEKAAVSLLAVRKEKKRLYLFGRKNKNTAGDKTARADGAAEKPVAKSAETGDKE